MNCSKCNRQFPWTGGVKISADGICFPCRWPSFWTEDDEATYRNAVKLYLEAHQPTKKEEKE
jgi:hypothetical protein